MGNSTEDESEIEHIQEVNALYYNFTVEAYKNLYMQLSPASDAEYEDLAGLIEFRYYEYDPKCATYTYWNGTDCEPNYNEYCASLLPQYKQYLKNTNVTIVFNGTACVMVLGDNPNDPTQVY